MYIDVNLQLNENKYGDPDSKSKKMQEYHQYIYSRQLPNGQYMQLKAGNGKDYLTWNNFKFGSDSIIVSLIYYKRNAWLNKIVEEYLKDNNDNTIIEYKKIEYTIGTEIIFPKYPMSINRYKGMNRKISDRFDFTLQCIKDYYNDLDNPLTKCLKADKEFFDLFVDFKGYIEFFLLQDFVNEDYSIRYFTKDKQRPISATPIDANEYMIFLNKQNEMFTARNKRIDDYFNNK